MKPAREWLGQTEEDFAKWQAQGIQLMPAPPHTFEWVEAIQADARADGRRDAVTFKPHGGKLLGTRWMCSCGNPEPIPYQKTSNRDEHAAQGRVDVGWARIAHCVRCNTVHFGVMTTRLDCVPAQLVEERDAKIRAEGWREGLEEAAKIADVCGHPVTAAAIRGPDPHETSRPYRDAVRTGIELAWAKCLELGDTMRHMQEVAEAEGANVCAGVLKKLRDVCLDIDELEQAKRKLLPRLAYKPEGS